MKKYVILTVVAGLLTLPVVNASAKGECRDEGFRESMKTKVQAHKQEQKSENEAFRQKLKSIEGLDAKYNAMVKHRETQYKENVQFRDQIHNGSMAQLKKVFDCRAQKQKERQAKKAEMGKTGESSADGMDSFDDLDF